MNKKVTFPVYPDLRTRKEIFGAQKEGIAPRKFYGRILATIKDRKKEGLFLMDDVSEIKGTGTICEKGTRYVSLLKGLFDDINVFNFNYAPFKLMEQVSEEKNFSILMPSTPFTNVEDYEPYPDTKEGYKEFKEDLVYFLTPPEVGKGYRTEWARFKESLNLRKVFKAYHHDKDYESKMNKFPMFIDKETRAICAFNGSRTPKTWYLSDFMSYMFYSALHERTYEASSASLRFVCIGRKPD